MGAVGTQDDLHSLQNDGQVTREGPVLDVVKVESDALLDGQVASTVDSATTL
jgi:hypothetical protein